MYQLVLTFYAIILSGSFLFAGSYAFNQYQGQNLSLEFERNITDHVKAFEEAFELCRAKGQCTATNTAGEVPSSLATTLSVRQLYSYLNFDPKPPLGFTYKVKFLSGGKTMILCLNPQTNPNQAAGITIAKPFMTAALAKLGGGATGTSYASYRSAPLTDFTYSYGALETFNDACNMLTLTAPTATTVYVGATKMFIDY